MEDAVILARLLNDPDMTIDTLWVMDMHRRFPAFFLPALLLLKRDPQSLDSLTMQRMQTVVSVSCPDRFALIDFVDPSGQDWANMYPQTQQQQSPSTEQTIEEFIAAYGQPSSDSEDQLIERLIMNPVQTDYFAEADTPFDPDDPLALPPELRRDPDVGAPQPAITPQQTETRPAKTTKASEKTPAHAEDSLLSESLAKIFIKQQRYERAYEIISKLSLNYPEKSVYFADQLRFLQKLMINQRHKSS